MGVRARLILFIVGVTCIVILAWGVTVVNGEAILQRREAQDRGLEVLRTLAVACSVSLSDHEVVELTPVLSAFQDGDAVEGGLTNVAILDGGGVVLAHSDASRVGETLADDFTQRALRDSAPVVEEVQDELGSKLRLSMPLLASERLGTATADVRLAYVEERIALMTRRIVVGSGLMSALGALALSVLISGSVLRPLEALSDTAVRVSRGDLSARVPDPARADEFGLLARVFNEMVATLAGQKARLEAEVDRRTEELESTNASLGLANDELARAVSKLELLASTDGLTGLVNHRTFQETLALEIRRAGRSRAPVCLLMIDVDHFKLYNDAHGHPAGDQVLIQISALLREALRDTDVVARYGGEEFAVILPDTTVGAARSVAGKLRDAVRLHTFPQAESQPEGRVTISLGVAAYPDHAVTGPALVEAADKALYEAKRLGRDRVASAGPEV